MTQEQIQKVEDNAKQIDEMAAMIIGNTTVELDNYIAIVRNCFLKESEILDDDLNKILLRIPTLTYHLIVLAQQLEMRKGLTKEQCKYTMNEALLSATGTVAEKQAKAENAAISDKLSQLAYTTAASIVSSKIDGAMAIYDAAKRVQQQRTKERVLTNLAGNAASGEF